MKTFSSFLISLFLCSAIIAQEASVVTTDVVNGGSMYYFHGRKVARTSTGTLMVIWVDIGDAGGQINYSIYDDAFNSWSPGAAISSAGDRADKPGIAADDLGNIHATWQERASSGDKYVIMYSKFNGTSWNAPVKVSLKDDENSEEATIEVDSKNNIWIAYNNDGAGAPDEFVYAVKSTDGGNTWSATPDKIAARGYIGSSITNGRVTLAAGPNGKLVATWHDGLMSDTGRREVFVNQYDGNNWLGEVIITDSTAVDRAANWYSTIAIDPGSNIYVFYHTNDVSTDSLRQRYVIVHKKTWDQTWDQSTTKVLHTETAGDMLATSAVADENGVVHFVYRKDVFDDTTGIDAMYYTFSKDGGDTWSEEIKLGRDGYDAGYVTIGNRVRTEYGIDIAFRESNSQYTNDQDTTTIIYENIPYSLIAVGVEEEQLPSNFELLKNYPNPFNPATAFVFNVVKAGNVQLKIYDVIGNEVRTLLDNELSSGAYKIIWNGKNNINKFVATGVYIASLKTLSGTTNIKVQLLK